MNICEFSPAYIRAIAPYQPGKPISELAREMGLDEARIVKLASNENPLGMSPKARQAILDAVDDLSRYPDGNAFELKSALSRKYGLAPDGIVVGNGSNDLLELVAGAFLRPGTSSVFSQHAFAVYPLATQARGADGVVVPAKNFGHDLDAIRRAITPTTRLVFVANPNNPTGTFLTPGEIEKFLSEVPPSVVVVLDEAYNEYLPEALRFDSVRWLDQFANLVITRTFSKAYGLAGLRVGYGLMRGPVADLLNRVRQPFNVNSLALSAALASLGDQEFVARSYALNRAGMKQIESGLREMGLEWIPSAGNFISFSVPDRDGKPGAAAVYMNLLKQGVIVRPVAGYAMPRHLRVTIGTASENQTFLDALRSALGA
jgi:histidinol-phosphate aminotransferase